MTDISQAIPQLTAVPICAYPAYGAIASAGCGSDLKCICSNENFFAAIQGVLATGNCTAAEAKTAITATRELCVEAVPWLGNNRGSEFIGALTVLLIIATLAVILRFVARYISRSPYGYDDWLILLALIWGYGLSTTQYLAMKYGAGKHVLLIDIENITKFGKVFFSGYLVFTVGMVALKISILLFYLRIFAVRKFTLWCAAIGVATIAWFIAAIVSTFLTCRPVECFWDKSNPDCKCTNGVHIAYFVTCPPDILTNIAILVLPIPWLWNLHMQTRRKVAVTFIFALGSFTVIGSIAPPFPLTTQSNISLQENLVSQIGDQNNKKGNASYSGALHTVVKSSIWLNVELYIGILSASLPMMRPLASRAFPSEVRSRFTRTRPTVGSQRLPDSATNNKKSHTLENQTRGKVYAGGKTHKSWFNNVSTVQATRNDDGESGLGSEEDMVPMGKIQVRHDVEWEREQEQERPPGTGVAQ